MEPLAARLLQLRELAQAFQTAVEYLTNMPLSSPTIRSSLHTATTEWQRLQTMQEAPAKVSVLAEISAASESLLDVVEKLTDHYQQAMQMLIGDRIGRMGCGKVVCPAGLEPATPSLEGWCSIQLSYGQ